MSEHCTIHHRKFAFFGYCGFDHTTGQAGEDWRCESCEIIRLEKELAAQCEATRQAERELATANANLANADEKITELQDFIQTAGLRTDTPPSAGVIPAAPATQPEATYPAHTVAELDPHDIQDAINRARPRQFMPSAHRLCVNCDSILPPDTQPGKTRCHRCE